jgi:pentatricopeptide repeat protein
VLDRLVAAGPAPTIRTVNALLEAHVRAGDLRGAERLFASLRAEPGAGRALCVTRASPGGVAVALAPTTASFNILCNGYARAGRVDAAVKLLLEMRRAS